MRVDTIDWMTSFDTTLRAEDKLVQYAVAARLGVRHPETIVASSAEELAVIGSEVVVKPLGVGHHSDDEAGARVVPAQALRTDDPRLAYLDGAPFIIQRRVRATAHLRAVTVQHDVFTARLPADDLPLDWRSDADAYHEFEPNPTPPDVRDGALRLAEELDVGYSSQDWAVADDGAYFLDLNPVGQWLFLPEPVSAAVTRAIAGWLDNSPPG
jgi:glutathione synthase/RimK-type ligase-like ATP-grasp enzyme